MLFLAIGQACALWAGGGPEAVCLLVNGEDEESRRIAETYAELRGIPEANLVVLTGIPNRDRISLAELKDLVLGPAFAELGNRELAGQIDYLVYSTGFPTRVSFSEEAKSHQWVANAEGSITGMTYLYRLLDEQRLPFLSPNANRYFGGRLRLQTMPTDGVELEAAGDLDFRAPQPFRARTSWNAGGMPSRDVEGVRYLICSMLGVTRGDRANSAAEIVAALERSAQADFSRPEGVFYFTRSGDLRSKVRNWAFDDAAARLKGMGFAAEVFEGTMPRGKPKVAGIMMGSASFDWIGAENQLLPGALCENLTSFGARFAGSHGQSLISQFVRAGAAGASGAVSEPYALQFKFPTPYLFVNYASGLSLGEAYYRSILSPYNLLLLGDPLCQPYAEVPRFEVSGIRDGDRVSGNVKLAVRMEKGRPARVRIAVDGRIVGEAGPRDRYLLQTKELAPAEHTVVVIVTGDDQIATQGRATYKITVMDNSVPR
ncbi:hypothetical protein [Pelagicoccus sp. SDUM812002]|uniref:hypothetical protein n=1 Tax=Pelagicoccus sp. SDUM812002 TaxID=3041266 RepID=UPI002810ECBC|nr:hypothetical protein [Pelagicoccus sp. SDUM812002]